MCDESESKSGLVERERLRGVRQWVHVSGDGLWGGEKKDI